MTGRRCDDSCVFISTAHLVYHSYKALNESKENKVTNEPKDKNVMQVWLAVPLRKNSYEFSKGMRKKYSHTLKDNFILNKADNQSFEIVAKKVLATFRGGDRECYRINSPILQIMWCI